MNDTQSSTNQREAADVCLLLSSHASSDALRPTAELEHWVERLYAEKNTTGSTQHLNTRWSHFRNRCQTYQVFPRSVRRSPAVRLSAPWHASASRLRSSCDPNGKGDTDSPFTNPSRVLNVSGDCVRAREHALRVLPLRDRPWGAEGGFYARLSPPRRPPSLAPLRDSINHWMTSTVGCKWTVFFWGGV